MRLITWNCNRGTAARKLPLIASLEPSLAILTECAPGSQSAGATLWLGDPGRPGISVTAYGQYRLSPLPCRDVPRFTFPVQVDGPLPFLLLAVWSKTDAGYRYVRAIIRAVECYRDLILAQPTVLLGDLNSNTIWDYKRAPEQSHTALVHALAGLRMASAYHSHYGEAHGAESRFTLYLLKQRSRGYHIDYCFLPDSWLPHLRSVHVGTFDTWIRHSDHVPLSIDLAEPLPRSGTQGLNRL